ncbi:MAG: hypothetical protein M3333_01750 [Actinomycetota bacterium]|nr:hypothetical protein [Actinomycetota bacterium]
MVEGIDDLFGLPLAEFTSSRNVLAARVAAGGDKAEARAIKSLRKPSIVAWTLNQLSRRNKDTVERLVATYIGGGATGNAEDLRSATEMRRRLVAELVDAAKDILSVGGVTSSQATLQKVSQALYTGGDEQDRELLLQGRLVNELSVQSLGSAFGLSSAIDEEPAGDADAEKLDALREAAGAAEQAASELGNAARRSEAEAERARAELARAEEVARRAADEAATARGLANETRAKLEEAANAAHGRGLPP